MLFRSRADVLNLLKHGFKNAIAINGTSVPQTIIELCAKKVVTAFVDGDRGGNLIIKELTSIADIDFVTKAPDGKEVEEITKKEIHKALRSRISGEQAKLELSREPERTSMELVKRAPYQQHQPQQQHSPQFQRPMQQRQPYAAPPPIRRPQISPEEKNAFKSMLEDLIGTRGAEILDNKLAVLGKVPISELHTALKSISNAYAVVFDGSIEREVVKAAEESNVKFLIGMDSKVRPNETRVSLLTINDL